MQIDWFTFVAQVVNFLILVALLRWLLYGPIVRAMQQREDRIAERLESAAAQEARADEEIRNYQKKTDTLEQQKEQLLEQARQEARAEQERRLEDARAEFDGRREQWQSVLKREQDDVLDELRQQAGRLSLLTARRALAELADQELEHVVCDTFLQRLSGLDDEGRQRIRDLAGDGDADVMVRSTFPIDDAHREKLQRAVAEHFEFDGQLEFTRSDTLLCGIELDVRGYCFGWNVDEYLNDLARKLDGTLTEGFADAPAVETNESSSET